MTANQLNLFSPSEISSVPSNKAPVLLMDVKTLKRWKLQISAHQQQVRTTEPIEQGTLFAVPQTHIDPDAINPFSLSLSPLSFYRSPVEDPGQSCLYFVIDVMANLLLYVGETCKSNHRWKGVHDCKGYIENYLDLHYQYDLPTAINIAFWWDAPVKTHPRKKLELALIKKWKSPFNKENWKYWSQPFG